MSRVKTYTSKEVEEVINSMIDETFDHDDLLFDPICLSSKAFMKSKFLDFLDMLCDTKEHADIFFSLMKSQKDIENNTYLISHWVYDQPEPYKSERLDNWIQIIEKIEDLCQRYYSCKWGEQTNKIKPRALDPSSIPAYNKFFDYDPDIMDHIKYLAKLCTNRPVYVGRKFLGYCKSFSSASVTTGHDRRFDDEDYRYYYVDKYTNTWKFEFHESPSEIVKRINADEISLKVHTPKKEYDEVPIKRAIFYNGTGSGWKNRYSGLHITDDNYINIKEDCIVIAK